MKIDYKSWALEACLLPEDCQIKDLSEEEKNQYHIEIGRAIEFCGWLKDRGYLRDGVEI